VSTYFQVQDFWAAGLGCDLGGAFLLARGLINRPAELTRLAGSFYGSNRFLALSVARNRLDAITGVTGLLVGFGLQAVGYIASLATAHTLRVGTREAVVAGGLALSTAIVTIGTGNLTRRYRLVPLLVEMSHFEMNDERLDFPRRGLLPGWLAALGHEQHDSEDDLAFVRRVAGVEDLMVDLAGQEKPRRWTDVPPAEIPT
jgi:hypothetical protein